MREYAAAVLTSKLKFDPSKLSYRAKILLPFMAEVFSLDFETEPNYTKLKHLLVVPLLDMN